MIGSIRFVLIWELMHAKSRIAGSGFLCDKTGRLQSNMHNLTQHDRRTSGDVEYLLFHPRLCNKVYLGQRSGLTSNC